MKYTILHTIETGGPGGAETVLLTLASRLADDRYRSIALVPSDGWLRRKLLAAGIPTVIADSNAWYDFRLPRALANTIRREKVDLIHSHLLGQNFYSCLIGYPLGRKTVVTFHGLLRSSEVGGMKGMIRVQTVKRWASAVVAVSDHLEQSLRRLGFPAEKLIRIYNGIDLDRFPMAEGDRLRRELQCPPHTQLVGMVANMRESKGYEHFVHAARLLANSIPQARFVAVGETEPRLNAELNDLVRKLGMQDRFLFLGFREDVPQILCDLDVFVLSSVSEGFSLSTVEAMATGRPVVATRSGGPQEIVEDGKTGLLVPPSNAEALADAIRHLLTHPAYAAQLGQNARLRVERDFSLRRMVQEYEILYERCLNAA